MPGDKQIGNEMKTKNILVNNWLNFTTFAPNNTHAPTIAATPYIDNSKKRDCA